MGKEVVAVALTLGRNGTRSMREVRSMEYGVLRVDLFSRRNWRGKREVGR